VSSHQTRSRRTPSAYDLIVAGLLRSTRGWSSTAPARDADRPGRRRARHLTPNVWTWRGRTIEKCAVEDEDLPDVESFGDRDDAGVGGAERQVRVALDKLG
jgi:hypothetical protein